MASDWAGTPGAEFGEECLTRNCEVVGPHSPSQCRPLTVGDVPATHSEFVEITIAVDGVYHKIRHTFSDIDRENIWKVSTEKHNELLLELWQRGKLPGLGNYQMEEPK